MSGETQPKQSGRHLLGMRGISAETLSDYIERALAFIEVSERPIKKVPALRGKTIINLFLEPSTRTRASFEIAGKRLSADTINISGSGSSVKKGESLLDTARTLQAMAPDILILRHSASGAPHFISQHLKHTIVVNAGDGMNEHPSQALLDLLSLRRRYDLPLTEWSRKKVAIIGDIRHSRVARSNIWAHLALGNEVRLIGPPPLVPASLGEPECFGERIQVYHELERGIEGVDILIVLRMQLERQEEFFTASLDEYSRFYGLNQEKLDRYCPDAVLLHPGPANRGVEINGSLLYEQRSLVEEQVRYGVAVRMAVLFELGTKRFAPSPAAIESTISAEGGPE